MRLRAVGLCGLVATALGASACGSDVSVFGPSAGQGGSGAEGGIEASSGGAGGTSSSAEGGTGGAPSCVDDTPCLVDAVCVDGHCDLSTNTCALANHAAGTPCGEDGQVCDGMGLCTVPVGAPCTDGFECGSGFCSDGVCCDALCDGTCEACDLPGLEGNCLPHDPGTDPETECAGGSCDGTGSCASGDVLWAKRYGDGDDQWGHEVTSDSAGNAIITGYFDSTLDFGGGTLTSPSFHDVYLAKIDPAGSELWSQRFGGNYIQWGWDVVTDGSDNVILGGYYYNTIDFGLGELSALNERDTFVAKLDPSGTPLWSKSFGGTGEELLHTVAAGPGGKVAIAGYYTGSISFGQGATHTSSGNLDVFLAVLNANGTPLWSKSFGDASEQRAYDVAFDKQGNVILTGRFYGTVDFGDGSKTSAGQTDAFVAKFDNAGNTVFSAQYGDAAYQFIRGVDVDAQNNIVIAGYTNGGIDLGGGLLSPSGGFDVFVAKLDPSGLHLSSSIFGGPGDARSRDLELDAAGNLLISGTASGSPDFGGGPLTTSGVDDAFVVKLTADGTHLWSHAFGGTDTQVAHGIAVAPGGEVFLTGWLEDFIDFGMGPLSSQGNEDVFLAKLAP